MGANGSQHSEIEIKFDAEAGYRLPALNGIPGVVTVGEAHVHELDAVYLDSPDLRLLRHGTTVRRRTGGDDAGWHLKLPVQKHERLEIRDSLQDGDHPVPDSLQSLVAVHLRGAEIEPVARISTHRTVRRLLGADDVVLAEVADDVVTAEAFGSELTTDTWREIEVELVEGDRTLLKAARKLLTAAGAVEATSDSKVQRILGRRLEELDESSSGSKPAPKLRAGRPSDASTAGAVAVDYLAGQLAALVAEDPRVKLEADEGVHQMRVATRRLRTALASLRPLFEAGSVESLRDELKWLGGELGTVRDIDVIQKRLHQELSQQPAELVAGPVLRRVDLELHAQREEARAHLLEALAGDRYFSLLGELEQFIAAPPLSKKAAAPAAPELRRRVRKACRRVQLAYEGLTRATTGEERDHQLHQVRIAAKRARYAAEAVRPVHGAKAKQLAKAMEAVQETLGEHQDAVVERAWLRDLAMRAFLAGENAFTFGRLHGLTEARALHDEEAFTRVWKRTGKQIGRWPG